MENSLALTPSFNELILVNWNIFDFKNAASFGFHFDRLSLAMLFFILPLGLVIYRYASQMLNGEARKKKFLIQLSITFSGAIIQVLSPSLAQFALGWIIVSFGLQGLLKTESHRLKAQKSARYKFYISRAGDLAMLLAMVAALGEFGTLNLMTTDQFFTGKDLSENLGHNFSSGLFTFLPSTGFFLVLAAFLKTASFPFQGWLLGSLEAPTPVSAFLHAGIINAGGFLLIRFQHLFFHDTAALSFLILLVLPSVFLGPIAMWAQSDYKRSLAWSTVGQMGFMLLQCGIGAFGPALLHLFGHGLYKANAFLRSGTLLGITEQKIAYPGIGQTSMRYILGFSASILGLGGIYFLLTPNISSLHGGWTLFFIQALAITQMAAGPSSHSFSWIGRGISALFVGMIYAGLTVGFEKIFEPIMAPITSLEVRGLSGMLLMIVIFITFMGLSALWLSLKSWIQFSWGKTLFISAAHGFPILNKGKV